MWTSAWIFARTLLWGRELGIDIHWDCILILSGASNSFYVHGVIPGHKNFGSILAENVAPRLAVLVEVRCELRSKLGAIGGQSTHQRIRNPSHELTIRLRRAIPTWAEISHFVFYLHHEYGLVSRVL